MLHFLFFFGFPGSILERKLGYILLGWGCIHHSWSHLLSLEWLCFFMDVQQSRKIFPGKSLLERIFHSHVVRVWSFALAEYISHNSFQSLSSLSSIPSHTSNFPPELDLGAAGSRGSEWLQSHAGCYGQFVPWGHHLLWQAKNTQGKELCQINGFVPWCHNTCLLASH